MQAYKTIIYRDYCFWSLIHSSLKDMDRYMNSVVATTLQGRKDEIAVAEKVRHEDVVV